MKRYSAFKLRRLEEPIFNRERDNLDFLNIIILLCRGQKISFIKLHLLESSKKQPFTQQVPFSKQRPATLSSATRGGFQIYGGSQAGIV